ncbi:histidine kinase [Paenibacillus sp. HB172176]|uniref:sensor histidine kinase n=1 Tax=Paenibacillus sp. HB172176 TaxID=2493690 RepID=UPI00143A264C|nr:histidine kinase [Paenibacillus sp. HB172176]
MWKRLIPKTLTYRLFASFLLFIVIPFLAIQLYNYAQIEKIIGKQLSDKNNEQLDFIMNNLANVRSNLFVHMLQIELNPAIMGQLEQEQGQEPERIGVPDQEEQIIPALQQYREQYRPYGEDYVQFEIVDRQGFVHGSMDAQAIEDPDMQQSHVFRELEQGEEDFRWVLKDKLFLYALIQSDDKIAGWLKITFDYAGWLDSFSRNLLIQQDYMILDGNGRILAQTDSNARLDENVIARILKTDQEKASFIDQKNASLVNAGYVRSLDFHIASMFTLDLYFGSLDQIKKQLITTFIITVLVFVFITFAISSSITRPLKLLQKKMSDMVQENFQKSKISEHSYQGEILTLAQTFNRMVNDIQELIQQLKMEVREREAIRLQMLLIQMNPHFLLNTLNLIKWSALEKEDRETAEICIALGTLLEQSLASDVEIIHLHKELELLQAYDYIQQIRFGGRYRIRYEFQEELNYALVPKFILQPLVENAINYGFAQLKRDGVITIRAYTREQILILEVEDNGVGYRAREKTDKRKRKGIGLANIQERLALLFRHEGELTIEEVNPGTCVTIRMPLLLSAPKELE